MNNLQTQKSSSSAFLFEMLFILGFFLISSTIFVAAFAKAESVSQKASALTYAVEHASNLLEESISLGSEAKDRTIYYDQSWNPCDASAFQYMAQLDVKHDSGLMIFSVSVCDSKGEELYTLSTSHAETTQERKGGAVYN